MAKVFKLQDIELAAENVEQAKEAKAAIINIIKNYDVDAAGIIQLYKYAEQNKSSIRSVISDLRAGKPLNIAKIASKFLFKK